MDENLKARLDKYLDALEKGATRAGEFAEVEIPATIREYLVWYGVEHAIYAVCFVAVALVCFLMGRRFYPAVKKYLDDNQAWDEPPVIGLVVSWILKNLVPWLFLIGFVVHAMDVVKVCVSPRIVLVEKVADVVKGKK